MKKKLNEILTIIQYSRASHQKNLKIVQNYYEKACLDEFVDEICTCLKYILCTNLLKNENVQRALDFLAQFISAVTPIEEDDFLDTDDPHPLLTKVIVETLKYHDVAFDFVRYNSCLFIRLILHRIGPDTNLDNEVCDLIEEAMLERTQDPKASVRLQAVMALLRLQVPTNPNCPVISAYLSLMTDSSAAVRAEIVKTVAPYAGTIPQIVRRLLDVDHSVRAIAFRRCADLGPKYFKIVERQQILRCGLCESHPTAKKVFVENLLVKWLNAYDEDYVEFLRALKLDGDESDIANTQEISRRIVTILLDTVPIAKVSEVLSLENKLIPSGGISSETSTLWSIAVSYLRRHDELEDLLEDMIPELTTFANYIQSVSAKAKEKHLEDWEYLDYQATLNNLLEIVEGFDLSDEVGRRTLYQLTLTLLREENLQFKVKKKIMSIAAQVAPKSDNFVTTVCHLISDIQEPLIESQCDPVPDPVDVINRDCQKAELKVKIIKLNSALEDATDNQEFLKADGLKNEIARLKTQFQELSEASLPKTRVEPTARPPKDDPKTICHCLDLLIALLELPSTKEMSPALNTVRDEFVLPLLDTDVAEINSRVLNCLAIYCFFDQSLVDQCVKILSIPIITYRKIPNYNKNALLISVKAIADLFQQYGENIFGCVAESTANIMNSMNNTRRRLYNDEIEDNSNGSPNRFHLESIIEVMLDMLDDEVSDIREVAVMAITKLVMNKFPVTPSLITRIVLKWYNPLTANASDSLQQLLGLLIVNYSNSVRGARENIVKSVIPILNGVANAPQSSPLADVDVDNLLRFLSVITNADDNKEVANTHLAMAHAFCYEMVKKKNAGIVCHLSKMMLLLEIPTENSSSIKELMAQLEIVLDEDNCSLDKSSRKNLLKFLVRLRTGTEQTQNSTGNVPLEIIPEENTDVENRTTDAPNVINETDDDDASATSPSVSNSSSANKDTTVSDAAENDRKRPRRRDASSETGGDPEKSPRRLSKRLKVCLTRLRTPSEAGAGKNGAGKNGAGKNGAEKNGAGENGAGKNGAGENGAGKNGAGENGAGENGAGKNGAGKNGAGKNGAGENGAGKNGAGNRADGRRKRKNNGLARRRGAARISLSTSSEMDERAEETGPKRSKAPRNDSSDSETRAANKKRPKLDGNGGKKKNGMAERGSRERNGNISKNASQQVLEKDARRITRNGRKISEELNSSTETILHTILQDISQVSDQPDISSFNSSSNDTVTSRRSTRLSAVSSNDSSSIIEPVSKKLGRAMKMTEYSNEPSRRSARKMRKK